MIEDDLETALRARWDHETLAVYADHLEARGEPRGELISIDLRIDEVGPTPELLASRRALIEKWFGFQPPGVRHGFVDIDATSADPVEQLALLDGPAAPFVRSITMVGAPTTIAAGIAKLSETPRPWLVKLVIRQWSETAPLDGPALDALVAATPHLAQLEVDGRRVLGELVHPAVLRLRVSGIDAVGSLLGRRTLPIESLDFAFHAHLADAHEKRLAAGLVDGLLRADRFAALTALDLSRNEPGFLDPITLGGGEPVFGWLARLAVTRQLVTLRLPRVTTTAHVQLVNRMLDAMPALRELAIRSSPLASQIKHPALTVFG